MHVIVSFIYCLIFNLFKKKVSKFVLSHLKKIYFYFQGKFIVLQLVLLFAKFQGIIARVVVWTGGITCKPPITASVYTNRKQQLTL